MANESEVRSILSLSTRSDGSTAAQLVRSRWRNTPLHERCSMNDMLKLKEAFEAAYRNVMFRQEFRDLLLNLLNVEYDDEEFKILFLKINTSRTGEMDWDEFVSHLILGYFGNEYDAENQRQMLQPPIMGLPTVMRSQHRHPVSRVCFCPDVAKDATLMNVRQNLE